MIEIYTDGSCWPNPSVNGGWSFVVYENGRELCTFSGKADGITSSNRMEQTAMLRALLWLGDRPAVLHSDSRYVVDGLNLWSAKWQRNGWTRKDKATKKICNVMNADLWQVMVIARERQHEVRWVKGHVGHTGNERADQLAEAARSAPPDGDQNGIAAAANQSTVAVSRAGCFAVAGPHSSSPYT